jgi:hypothetical protein
MRKLSVTWLAAAASLILTAPVARAEFPGERVIGVGVQIVQNPELQTQVVGVVPQSPAQRGGILVGDLILAVDGRPTTGMGLDVVTAWLRGPGFIGSFVLLDVYTPSTGFGRVLSLQREALGENCLLEGALRLRLVGSPESGWLSGSIGNQSVQWNVSFGRVNAYVGGRYSTLQMQILPSGRDLEVWGWLGSTSVRWRSFGAHFSGYQGCIRP